METVEGTAAIEVSLLWICPHCNEENCDSHEEPTSPLEIDCWNCHEKSSVTF